MTGPTRFDESMHRLQPAGRIDVRCDRCGARARVVHAGVAHEARLVRLSCTACGRSAERTTKGDGSIKELPPLRGGAAGVTEPVFGLPLWLQARTCGHVLWAFDVEHLDFIERFIAADQRERHLWTDADGRRHTDMFYGNIPAAFPAWMKSAGNRDELLRAIARLRETLD